MAHGLNSMIKREIDCSSVSIKSQLGQPSIASTSATVSSSVSPSGSGTPCGNAKMGSRRIFTPQFKLQVLESYRNDSDCKGNQRATARKYGIHRRQIQKWLQCESNLRSSVANLNQSNMKHQFHNVSHQMPSAPHTSVSHQQQYKATLVSLDTRHSVSITPMTLPALPTTTAVTTACSVARPAATAKCVNGLNHGTTTMVSTAPPQTTYRIPVPDAAMVTHTPALATLPPMPPYQHQHQQQQHQENRLLMPSACLPVPGSPVSAATNRSGELRDYQPITVPGTCYMNEDYRNPPHYVGLRHLGGYGGIAPIDLSLGPRRRKVDTSSDRMWYMRPSEEKSWHTMTNDNNNNLGTFEQNPKKDPNSNADPFSYAVDLSCRKRRSAGTDEATHEKLQKRCDNEESEAIASVSGPDAGVGQDEEQQQPQQAKPVKLFKPYLLDEDVEDKKSVKCEQRDPIIWSHHPTCVTPGGYESQRSSGGGTFPLSPSERYPFPVGSPTFQIQGAYDRASTATPASLQSAAGGATYWCPKSSPVSGYDSASTYSDSSDNYRPSQQHLQTYSLDLKMQAIDSYYHDLTCRGNQMAVAGKYNVHSSEVQRWLDQETNIRQVYNLDNMYGDESV